MAARLLLWLAWRSGTLSRTISGILMLVTIDNFKHLLKMFFCFQRTSAISTLDMLRLCTLQIYLLTINTSLLLICRHYSNASTKPSGALYTKISFSDYVTISTQKTVAIWHGTRDLQIIDIFCQGNKIVHHNVKNSAATNSVTSCHKGTSQICTSNKSTRNTRTAQTSIKAGHLVYFQVQRLHF